MKLHAKHRKDRLESCVSSGAMEPLHGVESEIKSYLSFSLSPGMLILAIGG